MQDISSKVKLLKISTSRLVDNILLWNYKTNFKWSWIEFADIREYQEWDSFRSIDRQTSAKQWKLYIKKYEEERQLTIFFLVDIAQSMQFWLNQKKIITATEVLYTIALLALQSNDKIWAVFYDKDVQKTLIPKKWKKQLARILGELEQFSIKTNSKFSNTDAALSHINKLPYKNTLLFVLTDDVTIQQKNIYKVSAIKHDVIFLNIFDQFENTLTYSTRSKQRFPQRSFSIRWVSKFISITNTNKQKKLHYQKQIADKIKSFSLDLAKFGIRHASIDEQSDIILKLMHCFQNN